LPDANHPNSTYRVEESVVYAMTQTASHLSVPDDLHSLSFEEEGQAASFPLPDGVPDALVNKYQLAARRRRYTSTSTGRMRQCKPWAFRDLIPPAPVQHDVAIHGGGAGSGPLRRGVNADSEI